MTTAAQITLLDQVLNNFLNFFLSVFQQFRPLLQTFLFQNVTKHITTPVKDTCKFSCRDIR